MTKALVLSGGGSVGIAWQTGLAAGLAREGVRLADADFIVGTSAGSAVGATLALGLDLDARIEQYGTSRTPSSGSSGSSAAGGRSGAPSAAGMAGLMQVMAAAQSGDITPEEGRAAIGKFALEADALPEDRFVSGFSYLAGKGWPKGYACTAVDAETGEFQVWDETTDAPLDRAVASSCAVPGIFAPITINGRRYIDGGMRSGTNADLAAGHDRVLIVTLMARPAAAGGAAGAGAAPGGDERMARYLARAQEEHRVLTEAGATIETVGPDAGASAAIGMNLMDGSLAPAAAVEGVRQGQESAGTMAAFWNA